MITNAEQEYIDERRDRLNKLAELAREKGKTIPCPVEPPKLNEDGSLAEPAK